MRCFVIEKLELNNSRISIALYRLNFRGEVVKHSAALSSVEYERYRLLTSFSLEARHVRQSDIIQRYEGRIYVVANTPQILLILSTYTIKIQ